MTEFLCFDIESCDGGSVGSMCSLGYIRATDGDITDKQDLLINPACGFNPMLLKGKNFRLQYPKSVYRASPTFDRYYENIKNLFLGKVILGFSVANDVKYINDACMYYGLDFIDYEFVDIQTLLALHLGERRNYALSFAAERYGIEFCPHSSGDDAEASFKVLLGRLREENLSFEQLLRKYSLTPGKNESGIIYPCRSPHPAVATITDSKTAIAKLNTEFLRAAKKGKGEFSKTTFCFEESFEQRVDFRSILTKVYEMGGECTFNPLECNRFVASETNGKRLAIAIQRGKKILPQNDFFDLLSNYEILTFDDEQILLSRRAREQQERIDEYKKLKKKD